MILKPVREATEWREFLADPQKQWMPRYSAWELAHSWHAARRLPPEVHAALRTVFPSVELLLAIPEWKVALPGRGYPSQNDLFALCRSDAHLIAMAVEGKVGEPFGPTLDEWLRDPSKGKETRLAGLCEILGLDCPPDGHIRYQLLHRTASAVLEARRFNASDAVMLVHSFSATGEWFADYAAFSGLFGVQPEAGRLHTVQNGEVALHLGWSQGPMCGGEHDAREGKRAEGHSDPGGRLAPKPLESEPRTTGNVR